MRVLKNDYIMKWENDRQNEIKELTSKGIIPVIHDMETKSASNEAITPEQMLAGRPLLMGQCAGAVKDIKPAKQIVEEMVSEAIHSLRHATGLIAPMKAAL